MHLATRIAAWVLAIYALGYGVLLLLVAPFAGLFLLLLIPAGVAIYAAILMNSVLLGHHHGAHFLVTVLLAAPALIFGAIASASGEGGLGGFLYFGLPCVLSVWIGGAYLWSGVQSFRKAGP